jgi:hypothetical protein
MKMLKLSILTLAVMLAATSPAGAHGAIAIGGNPANAETRGIAVGIVQNYATPEVAEAEAVKKCLAFTGAPKKTVALCKVVRSFQHEWVVVALDPKPSTPGFGWSIDPDKAVAERNAMDQCKVSSTPARKPFCEVAGEMGDTKP